MEYAFLSRLSAAHAPNLAHRAAQNKPGQIKQAIEALRAGLCPAARSRPHQRWERGPTACVRKKGSREGEKTLVFPPREIRAEALCRTHSRSALSERFLGMIVFKDINIFREIALSEPSFGAPIKRFQMNPRFSNGESEFQENVFKCLKHKTIRKRVFGKSSFLNKQMLASILRPPTPPAPPLPPAPPPRQNTRWPN